MEVRSNPGGGTGQVAGAGGGRRLQAAVRSQGQGGQRAGEARRVHHAIVQQQMTGARCAGGLGVEEPQSGVFHGIGSHSPAGFAVPLGDLQRGIEPAAVLICDDVTWIEHGCDAGRRQTAVLPQQEGENARCTVVGAGTDSNHDGRHSASSSEQGYRASRRGERRFIAVKEISCASDP